MTNKQTDFRQGVKECVLRWVHATSIHGIERLIGTKTIVSFLFWMLSLCAAMCYMLALSINIIGLFSRREIRISRVEKVVREVYTFLKISHLLLLMNPLISKNQAVFPSVTFCNLNFFVNEASAEKTFRRFGLARQLRILKCLRNTSQIANGECTNGAEKDSMLTLMFIKIHIANFLGNSSQRALSSASYDLKRHMFISCEFNGKSCNVSWFKPFWSLENGMCYTFDSNNSLTDKTGPKHGLRLVLQIKSDESYLEYRTGIYLAAHNKSEPVDTIFSRGILIKPGTETYVGVKRKVFKADGINKKCIEDLNGLSKKCPYLSAYFEKMNVTVYSQNLCIDFCYQLILYDKCNCCDIKTGCRYKRFCLSYTEIDCLNNFYKNFLETDNTCTRFCLDKCEQQKFYLSSSYSTFPKENAYNKSRLPIRIKKPDASIKDFILSVIVNYEELSYIIITEVPTISLSQLIGSLGGNIGLCMGMSLMTLVELINLLFELIHLCFYDGINRLALKIKKSKFLQFSRKLMAYRDKQKTEHGSQT